MIKTGHQWNDKRFGEIYERAYIQMLRDGGARAEKNPNKYGTDIIVNGGIRHEVKADRRVIETGNFAIEMMDRGRESGIRASDASAWVIIHALNQPPFGYVVDAKYLRGYAEQELQRYPVGMGDDNAATGILLPKSNLKRWSRENPTKCRRFTLDRYAEWIDAELVKLGYPEGTVVAPTLSLPLGV